MWLRLPAKSNWPTGVYILPLRNPFSVAKAIASLDQLSNGRFCSVSHRLAQGGVRVDRNGWDEPRPPQQ
ncbi:MAG: LLM class flavin-dependent oxidoreductase [Deltaproteobacteria bacterium]|nr:LLM class flavin-dependent oxidoreductase [Deltaproteobacteria bacterium]